MAARLTFLGESASAVRAADAVKIALTEVAAASKTAATESVNAAKVQIDASRAIQQAQETLAATTIAGGQAVVEQQAVKVAALREEIIVARQVAATYKAGSTEQAIAIERVNGLLRQQAALAGRAAEAQAAGGTERAAGGVVGRIRARTGLGAEESGIRRGFLSRATGVGGFIAGPGFIAGAVTAIAAKQSLDALHAIQEETSQLQGAVKNAGGSWSEYRGRIEETVKAMEGLGVKQSDTLRGMTTFVRVTGSVEKSQRLMALAVNIARGAHIDTNTAVGALVQAENGRFRGLQRLIGPIQTVTKYEDQLKNAHIKVTDANRDQVTALQHRAVAMDKSLTMQRAISTAETKFAGEAQRHMHTAAGAADARRVAIERLEVSIGRGLLPIETKLSTAIANVADKMRTSERFHRDLAKVGDVLKTVWSGAVTVFDAVRAAMGNRFVRAAVLATGAVVAFLAVFDAAPILAIVVASLYAIGEIKKHWNGISRFFKGLWVYISNGFEMMWDQMKLMALQAYLDILEPFSHLPGRMGGWARRAKEGVLGQMDDLRGDMAKRGVLIGNAFGDSLYNTVTAAAIKTAGSVTAAMAAAGPSGEHAGQGEQAGPTVTGGVQGRLVSTAKTALGNPYKFGGAPSLSKPTDCSGLMVAVFQKEGIHLPRTSQEQYAQAPIKNRKPLLAGDLVFSEGVHPGHVGLYIGGGSVLEDPHTGDKVKIVSLDSFGWNGESARWWGGKKRGHGGGGGGDGTTTKSSTTTSTSGSSSFGGDVAAAAAAGNKGKKPKPSSASAGAASANKRTFSFAELMGLWIHAGGPENVAHIAAAIAKAESGGRSWATNKNSNGSIDYGAWQINSVHGYDAERLLDVDQQFNAHAAVSIWHGSGFGAWTTYRNGAYLPFMREFAGTKPTMPGGGSQAGGSVVGEPTLIGVRGGITRAITAAQKSIHTMVSGDDLDPGVKPFYTYTIPAAIQKSIDVAEAHLRALRAKLSTPMTPTALARLRQNIKLWEQNLKNALDDAGKGASAAAQIASQHEQNAMRDVQNALQRAFDAQTNNYVKAYQRATQAYEQEFNDTTQRTLENMKVMVHTAQGSFLFGGNITQTPSEARLAAMQKEDTQRGLKDSLSSAQAALTQAQLVGDPQQIADAQKEVDKARRDQLESDLQDQAQTERDAAEKQLAAAKDAYSRERQAALDAYEQQRQDALDSYQTMRADQWQAFMDSLADQNIYYQMGLESWTDYVHNLAHALSDMGVTISDTIIDKLIKDYAGGGNTKEVRANDALEQRQKAIDQATAAGGKGSAAPGGKAGVAQTGAFVPGPRTFQLAEHEPEIVMPWSWLPKPMQAWMGDIMRRRGVQGADKIPMARMRGAATGVFIDEGPSILVGQPITQNTGGATYSTSSAPTQDPVKVATQAAVTAAVAAQRAAASVPAAAAHAAAVAAAAQSGPPMTTFQVQVTVQGSAVKERDLALSVKDELIRWARSNGVKIFGGYA